MSLNKCKVAVCQFTATNDKSRNLKIVRKQVAEAGTGGAKVVFLPEACDYIGNSFEESKQLAEPLNGPLMSEYKAIAKECNVWLSIGGFHELLDGKLYNSHVLIDDSGEVQSIYKKIHLFDVVIPEKSINLKESDNTSPGLEITSPILTPAGPLALSICYDLRFPELSTIQRKLGACILTYPSAFTSQTGLMHWEVLLRSRAIETQCYVVAAAQYGKHNENRTSFGQAMIVDPWGKIVAQCPKYSEESDTNEEVAFAAIDLDLVKDVRQSMPVLQHRRDDLYRLSLSQKEPSAGIHDSETFMFADKVIPASTVFYKTKHSFAFTNIRCVVPGHVLVASLRPSKRLVFLSQEEIADLFKVVVSVQKIMETVHSTDSTTICVQDGKDAGQTVGHVHVHILPRKPHDFDRNDEIYDALAKHDRDNNLEPVRKLEEQIAEAQLLRKYFV